MALTPRGGTAFALAACVLHALVRLVPWDAGPVELGLDASWKWVLHAVWQQPLVWAKDVVFTWGPYGFLLTGTYHPATFAATIALASAIAVVLVLAFWRIVRSRVRAGASAHASGRALLVSSAWTVVLVELVALSNPAESLFYFVDFALVWLHGNLAREGSAQRPRLDGLLLHSLCVIAVLGGFVKFTYLLGAAVAVGAIVAHDVLFRRRFPWTLPTFLASVVGWWLIARQPLSALGDYLATSLELSAGYTEAMGLPAPFRVVAAYLAAAAIVLALLVGTLESARPPPEPAPRALALGDAPHALALLALAFLTFKGSFVRFDVWHALPGSTALLFWLAAAVASRGASRRPRVELAAAAGALVLILVSIDGALRADSARGDPLVNDPLRTDPATAAAPPRAERRLAGLWADHLAALPGRAAAAVRVVSGDSGYTARHEAAIAEVRRLVPLPKVRGAVDVYPALAGIVLAHELDYRPRPVFQSYCAFTPDLLELNAVHLAGPRAPERIFWTLAPLDSRLPSMDDSLSWPVVLSLYEVVRSPGSPLILRPRSQARRLERRPLATRRASFGEVVPVPVGEERALWVEIELERTWLGRAAGALFRAPGLSIGIRTADGRDRTYRLVPGIAEAGFLLSPCLDLDEQFRRFAVDLRSTSASETVRDFTVSSPESDDVAWAYRREYAVRLSALEAAR